MNSNIIVSDRFLRPKHLCRKLGMSRTTLYDRIARGELPPPMKLGERTSVWRESEIDAWMAAVATPTETPRLRAARLAAEARL